MKNNISPDLSLGLTTGTPIEISLKLSKIASKNKYKTIWIGDDILNYEAFTYTSIIANQVKNIRIGLGVISPYVYPITTIASAAAALAELTFNNFNLGLGVGGPIEVERLTGLKPKHPVNRLQNTVTLLKKIFNKEKVSFEYEEEKLVEFKLPFIKYDIPIYLGVRGPKLLELAGKIADGVIFSAPISLLKDSLNIVKKAAVEAHRNPDDIKKILWNGFILSNNINDLKLAKSVVLTIINSMSDSLLTSLKVDVNLFNQIKKEFLKGNKTQAADYITDEMIREFCFFGELEELKQQFIKIKSMGVDEIIVGPPFSSNPFKAVKAMSPKKIWGK
ncbi:MAG: LLM class flavin-dependent oxidoreductase [Candidatus Odinarchaeum yellowstonii]|uniref:LLM class flavin-dependent oxidoreductase n=1 Tax=Odinarchaeota yellowstonii (strain LCB_4) TaxID=1841599 RepID=A0AAF0D140_ODILC|nr:MAG: LLM class flavin-dependent oxidoreductase [Candidatus Odinarchaeum yellowstonii]